MFKNYIRVSLNTLLIFACVFFQSCKDQDAIAPQEDQVTANNDVLQKIKSLGFADNQIKETSDYYLADGDLYFSKKISSVVTAPVKKSGQRILQKYGTVTIHVDESLANAIDEHWRAGIDQAIAEWNANEEVHFHFAFTNSPSANINIIKDTDLPKDLAIASEFPRDGRTGSSIRINVDATTAMKDPKQAFAHALEHCVGFRHSTSVKNKEVTVNSNALKSARGPRYPWELYAIQGDVLYRIDALSGTYYAVNSGWEGTEVMGQVDGLLYMVQFGTLYAVNPSTGSRTPLTDGWEGSQYITSIHDFDPPYLGKLYIMQSSTIWPVDPETGLWGGDLGKYTLARGLVGFTDCRNQDKLAVLRRKPGSSTVSLIYYINPSNGASFLNEPMTLPASGVSGWNNNFLLTSSKSCITITEVFNGRLSFASPNGYRGYYPDSSWPDVELVTGIPNFLFLISKGTLYLVNMQGPAPYPTAGVQNAKQLGKLNDWTNTSCLVFLDFP